MKTNLLRQQTLEYKPLHNDENIERSTTAEV